MTVLRDSIADLVYGSDKLVTGLGHYATWASFSVQTIGRNGNKRAKGVPPFNWIELDGPKSPHPPSVC